jgi:methionyl-tRNA formyltransferase
VFQPEKIKAKEAVSQLQSYGAELFVVAAFGQILSKEILEMPRFGCINIHASLLPKYRGAAPIQQAILDGEKETGVTIMQMDEGLDTGDILTQCTVPISPEDTGGTLFDKLCEAGSRLLMETLPKIQAGTLVPVKQREEDSSYARMLNKKMGHIDFAKSAASIDCLIRGLNPWPSAYTFYRGKMMKLWRAAACMNTGAGEGKEKASSAQYSPGTIVSADKDCIYVQTGEGILKIYEIQLEGKKRMTVKDFMLGHPFETGEALG